MPVDPQRAVRFICRRSAKAAAIRLRHSVWADDYPSSFRRQLRRAGRLALLVFSVSRQLNLNGKDLDSVRVGQGEWDTEYAKVVNAVLPFRDCAAHVGGEGWGKNGVAWSDVQLRAYQTSLTEDQVHQSASTAGLRSARKFSKDATLLPFVTEEPWRRTTIKYSLFYGDYGGVARIDFYTRTEKGQTIVLVFMYCDSDRSRAMDQVGSILKSFQLQPSRLSS